MSVSKFTPEFRRKSLKLFRKGYTAKEVCNDLLISQETFCQYMKKYPEYSESVKQSREKSVEKVKDFLFKKCEGYFIEEEEVIGKYEETKEPILDKDGKPTGKFKITKGMKPHTIRKTKKHVPVDISAIKYYLSNIAPEEFKDKQEIEHFGKLEVDTRNLTLTKDELDELWRDVRKEKTPIDEPKTSE
jgi:hypothetical protein